MQSLKVLVLGSLVSMFSVANASGDVFSIQVSNESQLINGRQIQTTFDDGLLGPAQIACKNSMIGNVRKSLMDMVSKGFYVGDQLHQLSGISVDVKVLGNLSVDEANGKKASVDGALQISATAQVRADGLNFQAGPVVGASNDVSDRLAGGVASLIEGAIYLSLSPALPGTAKDFANYEYLGDCQMASTDLILNLQNAMMDSYRAAKYTAENQALKNSVNSK